MLPKGPVIIHRRPERVSGRAREICPEGKGGKERGMAAAVSETDGDEGGGGGGGEALSRRNSAAAEERILIIVG